MNAIRRIISWLTMTTTTIVGARSGVKDSFTDHFDFNRTTAPRLSFQTMTTTVKPMPGYVIYDHLSTVTENRRNVSNDDLDLVLNISVGRVSVAMVVLIIVWLLGVLGNTLVCLVIHRSRRLQSTTNYFVVSLAAADLVLLLIVGPFAAAQELIEAGTGARDGHPPVFAPPVPLCKFVRFVEQLVAGSTSFVFVAISADRFYAIVHPLQFTVTRSRAQRLAVGAWSIAAVVASPCFYFYGSYDALDSGGGSSGCARFATETAVIIQDGVSLSAAIAFVAISTSASFAAPSVVVCLYYTRVGKYIWRVGINGRTFQRTTNPVQRAKVKMVKMLITLNAVSSALTAPYFVAQLVACSPSTLDAGNGYKSVSDTASAVYAATLWMLFSSAAAKPIVYVTMNTNFRRGCKEVMCMSAMRCYRSHAYTITTTSALAKKNHVGILTTQSAASPPIPLYGPTSPAVAETHGMAGSPYNGISLPGSQFGGDGFGFNNDGSWPGPPASAGSANFSGVNVDSCGGGVEKSRLDGRSRCRSSSVHGRSTPTTDNGKDRPAQRGNAGRRPTAFDYSEVLQLNAHHQHLTGDHRRLQQQTISANSSSRSLQGREATTLYSTYV